MNTLASILTALVLILPVTASSTAPIAATAASSQTSSLPDPDVEPQATPLQCAAWKLTDPARYRKYCL